MLSLQTVDFDVVFSKTQNSISCQCQTWSKRSFTQFTGQTKTTNNTQLGVEENAGGSLISDDTLVSALVDDDVRRAFEQGHKHVEWFTAELHIPVD